MLGEDISATAEELKGEMCVGGSIAARNAEGKARDGCLEVRGVRRLRHGALVLQRSFQASLEGLARLHSILSLENRNAWTSAASACQQCGFLQVCGSS